MVARLLQKLPIDQTKSRSAADRTTTRSSRARMRPVVRKWMGHAHVPKGNAGPINEFYQKFLNPHLNFHRHCAYPTDYVDGKGKVRKRYDTYLTPCQSSSPFRIQTVPAARRDERKSRKRGDAPHSPRGGAGGAGGKIQLFKAMI